MEGISNSYIESTITTLIDLLGIKEHVDDARLFSLVRSGKMKEAIKEVARHLGLPIEVNLSYVPKGYKTNSADGFQSTHLVKTDWRGRGSEGITAQVSIPGHLPLYGTSGLNNFPVNIRISENCADSPATFIAVMAHELSHIVLHSLWHKEKDNEIYTDITAMILGFSTIMKNGRKVIQTTEHFNTRETQTTTYGYLSDDQFDFAHSKVEEVLNGYIEKKGKLIKKIRALKNGLAKKRKLIIYFQKYLEFVDKKPDQKMPQEDAHKISVLHQAGYTDEFESVMRTTENELKQLTSFVQNLNRYNEDRLNAMKQQGEKVRSLVENLDAKYGRLCDDVDTLKRYVSLWCKLKTFSKVFIA